MALSNSSMGDIVMKWEKEIKRQPRGHPDNIKRILQLLKGKRHKIIDGEVYIEMPEEKKNGCRV